MKTVFAAIIMAVIAYAALFVMLYSDSDHTAREACDDRYYAHNLAFQRGEVNYRIYCTGEGRAFRLEKEDPHSQPIWLD